MESDLADSSLLDLLMAALCVVFNGHHRSSVDIIAPRFQERINNSVCEVLAELTHNV